MNFEFFYDFASPNAHLSNEVLPGIVERTGVACVYKPVLLGGVFKLTNNRAPMEAFAGIDNKLKYMQLETQRFLKKHNITRYNRNPFFPVNTLQIMRGAVYARDKEWYDDYIKAVYEHMWVEPKNMSDPEVIGSALKESGLPAAEIMEGIQDPNVKSGLISATDEAVARGVFGIPTFFVDDQIYFGKDTLGQVEAALVGNE